MVQFEFDTDIARPADEVFAYLADPDRLALWQSSAVEVRKETGAPMDVGTRLTEVRRILGRQLETQVEITAYEPGRRLALKALSGPVPFAVEQTLTPTDGGTRVHFRGEGSPGGFFKLAEPLVARAVERQFKNDFQTLKDILESEGR
jgi:uncharacterized protein YndB with AHSA1/START domain